MFVGFANVFELLIFLSLRVYFSLYGYGPTDRASFALALKNTTPSGVLLRSSIGLSNWFPEYYSHLQDHPYSVVSCSIRE